MTLRELIRQALEFGSLDDEVYAKMNTRHKEWRTVQKEQRAPVTHVLTFQQGKLTIAFDEDALQEVKT